MVGAAGCHRHATEHGEVLREVGGKNDKKSRADNSDNSGEASSCSALDRMCKRKESIVSVFCEAVHEKSAWTLNVWLCSLYRFALG